MKKLLLIMVIAAGLALAQSESRTDPGTGVGEVATEQTVQAQPADQSAAPAGGQDLTSSSAPEGTAEETQPQTCMGGGGIMSFLPMIAIIAIFYFLMIRPQQKQAKMLREMRDAFQKDDRVVTNGGIHGVITNLKSDVITIRIADGVKIDVDRNSLQLESVETDRGR